MSNTITAYFKGRIGVAEAVYQNDYGIVMAFDSIDLPAHFECFFSKLNQEEAVPGLGADSRVAIPNSVLADPGNVTIHIPLHTGEDDSEVEYVVYFKVIGRARPIDDGTPTQMTAIERALALLSQPITNIEEIVNEALSFTGETFAEMKQELQDDFAEYKGDVDDDIADFKTEIRDDIADVEHDFDILDGQFQTAVAALTVDSEVQGIRTGDDGVTYDTAGNAVRKQFSNVKGEISELMPLIRIKNLVFNKYGLSRTSGNANNALTARLHTPTVMCNKGDVVYVPSGLKFTFFYYAVGSGYVGNAFDDEGSTWYQGGGYKAIPHTGLFSVVVSKDVESDFTEQECYDLNGTVKLYSSKTVSVSGIVFGAGHLDTANQAVQWGLKGNDYYYNSYSEQTAYLTTRWRTEERVQFYKGATIEIASGYRFYIFIYNSDDTVTLTQWYTGKYTFTDDKVIRLVLDKTGGVQTPYTQWDDLNEILTIKNNPEIIELETSIGVSTITTEALNKDMDDALVASSRYNTYVSGSWTSPVSKKNNLCFSVITDIHGSEDALNRFIEWSNIKKTYLDFCMGLGDFVVRQPSESTTWVDTAVAKAEIPFLYTVGNHDSADTDLSGITQASARTKYFSTIVTKGWLGAANFMDTNKCSWSKDFSSYKIRIISLFEYGNADTIASGAPGSYCRRWMDSALLQWFADTLYSTPDGYSVIVLLHQVPYNSVAYEDNSFTASHGFRQEPPHFLNTVDGNPIEEIVDAFINSTSISKTYNSIASYELGKTASVAKDFSARDEDGNFVCYFCGHAHTAYVLSSQNYPNQKTVVVNTGSENIYQRQYGDIMYDANTRNKDSFYCVAIDTELKKVNLIQIGGQVTADMRERTIATVSY